jgi:hypothetical protein
MTPRFIAILIVVVALAAQGQVYVSAPATGATAPTSANLTAVVSSGNLTGLIACDSSALLSMTTATTTQAIALQAGKSIYVCGFVINAGGTTTAKLVHGTGTNCATGIADLTPPFSLINGASVPFGNGVGRVLKTNSGSALCVTNSAAIAVRVLISYTAF